MRKWITALTAAGVCTLWGLQPASAQIGSYTPPSTGQRPPVSPYLNMLRNNPAINYFGIVKPQMETSRALQQLQQNQIYMQGALSGTGAMPTGTNDPNQANMFITGHPVMFMNMQPYFPMPGQRYTGIGAGGIGMGGMGIGGVGSGMNMGFGQGATSQQPFFGAVMGGGGHNIHTTPPPQGSPKK